MENMLPVYKKEFNMISFLKELYLDIYYLIFQRLRVLIRPQLKPHQIPAQYSVSMRAKNVLDVSQDSSREWDNPAFTASPVYYESNV